MAVSYRADGSAFCQGEADPTRTATISAGAGRDAAIAAFLALEPAPVTDPASLQGVAARTTSLENSMPTAASSAPPAVGDAGALGSAAAFARGDHTHASKVRKQRVTGVNTATYPWTYPSPFSNGVVPIVQAVAEDPANSTVDSYNIQVVGAPTATQAVIRIVRQTSGLFGLLLGAIGFNSTPGNVTLHLLALEP